MSMTELHRLIFYKIVSAKYKFLGKTPCDPNCGCGVSMVFFNCNSCGEALKKDKVENHSYRCHGCHSVSCIDCGKDFWGNDYQLHTSCISEVEKYGRKDCVVKPNKGQAKQEAWTEQVHSAIQQASSNTKLKDILQRLLNYPNIPRKEAKFKNFLKNSQGIRDNGLITQCWNVLMKSVKKPEANQNGTSQPPSVNNGNVAKLEESLPSEETQEVNTNTNENQAKLSKRERKEARQNKTKKEKKDKEVSDDTENRKKKKKKRKHEDSDDCGNIENDENGKKKNKKRKHDRISEEESSSKKRKVEEPCGENMKKKENGFINEDIAEDSESCKPSGKKGKFKWGATITALLNKKGEMSYKKLRRKVLQEFASQGAADYQDDSIGIKFDKKISKLSEVSIVGGRVTLNDSE